MYTNLEIVHLYFKVYWQNATARFFVHGMCHIQIEDAWHACKE